MNENENIITIEDEIKEFSDKPVKSSVLYKSITELTGRVDSIVGLPELPSTDGSYTLSLTVADGVPTYTWEAVE